MDSSVSDRLFRAPSFASVISQAMTCIKSAGALFSAAWRWGLLWCFVAAAMVGLQAVPHAQAAPAASPAVTPTVTPTPGRVEPAPIPLVEVATDAEAARVRVRDIQAQLAEERTAEAVAEQLPPLMREIEARLRETRKLLAQRPSIEMLDNLEAGWWRLGRNLYDWTWNLTRRASKLEEQIAELGELEKKWQQTLEAARSTEAPPELVRRVQIVLAEIKQAAEAIETRRGRLLTMQNRVAAQEARIADAFRSISEAREEVLTRLFVKDSSTIWSIDLSFRAARELLQDSQTSLATQWAALRAYADRETVRFLTHLMIFISIAAVLYWARHRVSLSLSEGADRHTIRVLDTPVAAALVLSVVCTWWSYPEAPRLLSATLLTLTLIATVVILRRLVERDLYPILYALVVFYCVHQTRALMAAVELLPRLLFLGELIALMLFLVWLVRAMRSPPTPESQTARLRRIIKFAGPIALAVSAITLVANVIGYVTLANLLGNALVRSAYLALILYAVVEILDGLFTVVLSIRPLTLLSTIRRHRPLLRRRVRLALKLIAIFVWILDLLERLLLRERLVKTARELLTAELTVGSLHLSLGDVLAFGFTVWAAFLISRLVRFLLDEDVYPRVRLTHGLPYAISTMLHYVILVVGFFAAVAALGLDMTKVTILAGAFTLGVGFGLQNIFNNFVSGIILLFERPVKVGDVIQIEDASGIVEHIGIRASIIRTTNGSDIIVPNGKLISERVINWTLSNRLHSIDLPITVAQGADPGRVISLLERTAAEHALVADDPPPQALMVKLSPESLGFELRAWTEHIEQWMQIRSELAITVSGALAADNIAIR
jgi:potassium efflux system protein